MGILDDITAEAQLQDDAMATMLLVSFAFKVAEEKGFISAAPFSCTELGVEQVNKVFKRGFMPTDEQLLDVVIHVFDIKGIKSDDPKDVWVKLVKIILEQAYENYRVRGDVRRDSEDQ